MTSNKVLYSGLASFTELARFHPIGVLHKWIMVGKNSNGFFFGGGEYKRNDYTNTYSYLQISSFIVKF